MGSFINEVNVGVLPDMVVFTNDGTRVLTSNEGDTRDYDGDGDYDELYSIGGRSFSIWNTATGELVWDSGDQLERITAEDPEWGFAFNPSHGTSPNFKNRSVDKGPEPE